MPNLDPILIVDDDQKLRFTLSVILKRAGYEVAAVPSAQHVLHYLERCSFSLLILDLRMPEMSGMELLSRLRCNYPKLPVIILTADDSLDSTIKALKLGARGVLIKPVNPSQVLAGIHEVLQDQEPCPKKTSTHLKRRGAFTENI